MKYFFLLLAVFVLAGCKKGESFDGFFGIQSSVVYSSSCPTTYVASYVDNNGNTTINDFQIGNKSWTVMMNSGKTAEITINTFGAPGTITISINSKQVATKSADSKGNVDLTFVVP